MLGYLICIGAVLLVGSVGQVGDGEALLERQQPLPLIANGRGVLPFDLGIFETDLGDLLDIVKAMGSSSKRQFLLH